LYIVVSALQKGMEIKEMGGEPRPPYEFTDFGFFTASPCGGKFELGWRINKGMWRSWRNCVAGVVNDKNGETTTSIRNQKTTLTSRKHLKHT
jgi:hypothetical protein